MDLRRFYASILVTEYILLHVSASRGRLLPKQGFSRFLESGVELSDQERLLGITTQEYYFLTAMCRSTPFRIRFYFSIILLYFVPYNNRRYYFFVSRAKSKADNLLNSYTECIAIKKKFLQYEQNLKVQTTSRFEATFKEISRFSQIKVKILLITLYFSFGFYARSLPGPV